MIRDREDQDYEFNSRYDYIYEAYGAEARALSVSEAALSKQYDVSAPFLKAEETVEQMQEFDEDICF